MNLALITTTPSTAQINSIINREGPKGTITKSNSERSPELTSLAKPPFNLNNAAKILISSLSQNGGEVEGLKVFIRETRQKDNQETDIFTAKFQGEIVTISIAKNLIPTGDDSNDLVGIPNQVTISSKKLGESITTTSKELGGTTQNSYIGEGVLNLVDFNLNRLRILK